MATSRASKKSAAAPAKSKAGKKNAGNTELGNAGELHQLAGGDTATLTTNQGLPIGDDQNSLKSHPRGPSLLEDFILREKITHFDHERIPERVVHARGTAAHGYFELTKSLRKYTTAKILTEVGERTPLFTRFSTVAGGAGSVDTPRDVRGFAVKFYTKEGNWDLVGNNIPVFFIQDAIKFPDLIHAVKMEPDRGFPQSATAHDTFWDYMSVTPEAMHMVMWAMSDRTIPRSLRMIEGFGIHTFRLINAQGESTFVKYHWRPKLGLQSQIWDEAVKTAGNDPDFQRRDLFQAIQSGDFPEWELGVQLFTEADAAKFPFDHLDATKLIPEERVPLQIIGRMVLDRWPDNFFAETEQVAFCPSHILPGMDFSNDPLLQGRLFSYLDTQLSRLGSANFHQLPINAPKCPFANHQRDAHMQTQVPKGQVAYEPNTLDGKAPRETRRGEFQSYPAEEAGARGRIRAESFADHYSQARLFYRSQTKPEQAHIATALVFELSKVETAGVRVAIVSHLRHIDEDLAQRVAKGLGLEALPAAAPTSTDVQDYPPSPALQLIGKRKDSLQGRSVGILVASGSDRATVEALSKAATEAGASVTLVAPALGNITPKKGKPFEIGGQLAGTPSVIFDAVAIVLADDAAAKLCQDSAAQDFVRDAFGHLKAIALDEGGRKLFEAAGLKADAGVIESSHASAFIKAAKNRQWDRESKVRSLA